MGIFNKLKNIFYDEEIVEEPETELKKVDREIKKETKEEKPIVEEIKVIKPETEHEIVEIKDIPQVDNTINERELFRSERKFSFTELDEEEENLPPRRNVLDLEKDRNTERTSFEAPQVEQPRVFKPSPIISPIYGILDKNYKKEDVKEKKEVNLSSYTRGRVSVDDIRNKAYGEKEEVESKVEVDEEEENLMVDLSDKAKPEVKEITVGDALEYFQDLGLEYNVDYVDASSEKKNTKVEEEPKEEEKKEEVKEEIEDTKEMESISTNEETADDNDNLFDLIDSMYQENN